MDQVLMRFEADYDIVLECIQEVYGLEGDNLRLGKDFRKTMVLPFVKMLERHCAASRWRTYIRCCGKSTRRVHAERTFWKRQTSF